MNGYKMMVECYNTLMEQGDIDKKTAEKKIRIYNFLATCDKEDKLELFSSSAFNDVVMGYVRLALDRVVTDEVTKQDIISELAYLIDTVEAKNAEAYWMQS